VSLGGTLLVADEIQDPGNMGTLIRTAVASGVRGLLAVEGSVDLYNPKVVRSTAGAIFHLPHWVFPRTRVLELLDSSESSVVVADLERAVDYWAVSYPQNVAVVIGNEARGVHELFRNRADLRVKIPLVGAVESLNASVASAVLLYEILRQRRCNNPGCVI
ncbi:MAG TPA: RNA methyltransferase, partial [Firmicutes bacterium]|nr:RNA methyltransferase [Bacillota bacterium]